MTVSTDDRRKEYAGNGITVVFTGPRAYLASQISVYLINAATQVATLQSGNYTIANLGGRRQTTITMNTAPVTGNNLLILLTVPYSQETDITNSGRYLPEVVEGMSDKLAMQIQQLADGVSRSLKLPDTVSGVADLPIPVPLAPVIVNAQGNGFEYGTNSGADLLLRPNLASTNVLQGIGLVFPYIESLGAKGDGVTLDDAVFATAAALGRMIKLRDGATYYLSQRVVGVTGTRFICDGMCKIKIKTGVLGFNNKSLNTLKNENSVFYFNGTDDNAVQGVEFITDGVVEVTIYPVRVIGGMTSRGCDFHRLKFNGLSLISGGYVSLNTIGAGGARYGDIEAINCGSAQGSAYWTGTPQITVLEFDNDMVGGVPSVPGYGYNIRATNVLLTGTALANYGQQTDVINIAGISGTDRKGQTIDGVYADGVGEVVDLFCTGATIRGVRAKNVHLFVTKFVHAARHNHVEVDVVESCGQGIVIFAGSSSLAVHTEHNTCHIRTAKGVGDAGTGPATADLSAVLFQENGGTLATCLPRNNIVTIDTLVGGANMDYVVRDNCSVNNTNNNLVRVARASGFQLAFCTSIHIPNMRARYLSAQACRLSIGVNQVLSTGVDAILQYQTVQSDVDGLSDTVNFKIKPKYPGWYTVRAQVRISGNNATDYMTISLKKSGGLSAQVTKGYATAATEIVHEGQQAIYIGENEVGTATADLTVSATHTGAATVTALNTTFMSYFEVTPSAG